MNSEFYMSVIEEKLICFREKIVLRGSINNLGLHNRAEDFYRELFNIIFGYQLENSNYENTNEPAFDLKDDLSKILFQITSTSTPSKINRSLSHNNLKKYHNYSFKFMFIGKENNSLYKNDYENPYHVSFEPKEDIYDTSKLIKIINSLDIEKMEKVYRYVLNNLNLTYISSLKINSLLPPIIKTLNNIDTSDNDSINMNSFEISEKIAYNQLESLEDMIREYSPYNTSLERIYEEYDKIGKMKSKSIFNKIRNIYFGICSYEEKSDIIFLRTIQELTKQLRDMTMIIELDISDEELEQCVSIIVVDVFIRCKIFKKPEG